MATNTTRAKLVKHAKNERDWDVGLNANLDKLDGMTAVGAFAVTPVSGLNVAVAAGTFTSSVGEAVAYAGSASFAATASATRKLWLTDAGVLTMGAAFPTTVHLPLATVVCNATEVLSVADERQPYRASAPSQGPFTSTYATSSQALGSSPTLADLTAFVNAMATALKATGALK